MTPSEPLIEPSPVEPEQLDAARVALMYRTAIVGVLAQTLVAGGLGAYLWLRHGQPLALAFAGWFVLVGIVRAGLWIAYRRASDVDAAPGGWLLAAALTLLAAGVGWGAGAYLFLPLEPLTVGVTVAAVGVAGILVFAPATQVMAAFCVPLFAGLLAPLVLAGQPAELVTAALVGVLALAMVLHSEGVRRQTREAQAVRIEKQRLVEALARARVEVDEVGEKLADESRQRARVEDEVKGAKIAAEAANMAKDEFLATMSHEIRTPLNGILPILDILRGTPLNDQQRDYLNTAFQSSKHLLTIIDDILDYSKIEAGKLALESVGINLRELLDAVVRLMAGSAERKGLALRTQIDSDVRLAMRGDPVRLKQVLTNLVSNAIKFTNEGSVTLTLSKRSDFARETELLFAVRDTGIGMDKRTAERLFQPFSQADASTTRTYGGTGLGLVICKRLVELMNGKIGVRSEQGRGSVFWFTVRLKKSLGDIQTGTRELAGSKALLATADRDLARRLGIFADRWETRLSTVANLREAADRLRSTAELGASWHFDTLILDAKLGNDVFALAADVRRNEALAELGILVLANDQDQPPAIASLERTAACPRDAAEGTFRDAIQALLDDDAAGATEEVAERELAYESGGAETTGPLRGRVLLVEDNPVNLHVAQRLLEVAGLKFEVAGNGKLAMDLLTADHQRFHAVIMDCMMPVMDGYAATRAWRAFEAERGLPRKPIIAMTANAMAGDRQKCLEAGMDDYMAKPMNLAVLKRTVGRWIGDVGDDAETIPAAARPAGPTPPEPAKQAPTAPAPAVSPPSPAGSEAVIDRDVLDDLRAIMGNDFDELIGVYLEDSPKAFRALVKAAEAGDVEAMVAPAHSLKSTSANLGALGLSEQARSIEHDARTGRVDHVNRRIAGMLRTYKRVATELQQLRAEAS